MEKYFAVLEKCHLFSDIALQDLPAMLTCLGARFRSYEKGETILREGEPARDVGVLLSGEAQIVRLDLFGNRSIVAGVFPSELFGEAFACAEVEALPISVVAVEPCRVMLMDCRRITTSCCSACSFHNRMIFNLLKVVSRKNILFHQKLTITSQRTTREKLMTYLNMEARRQGSSSFHIPFDRQALADYLEVERSGLSSEISKLKREGILESSRSWFHIL